MRHELTPPVEAVTFDLDYTLWDLAGVIEHAEARAYEVLAREFPRVADRLGAEDVRALRGEVAADRPEIVHDVTHLRREAFRRAGVAGGYAGQELDALVERVFHAFLDARHDVVLFEDTLPLLEWLRGQGVRVGALTNGNAEVERLGLGGYFDFALSAVDIGAAKPSHLVFEAARGRAGVIPERIVHVGDDPHSDVVGAAAFGMQAVWLNRAREPWPEDVPPRPRCVQIATLSELRERLAELLE